MQIFQKFEEKLEKLYSAKIIALLSVIVMGLLLRIFFTPWDLLTNSPDAFVYMIEGISYSNGDFEYFNTRFLWPVFLSLFFSLSETNDTMSYITIMRIVSISISVATIPILYLISKSFLDEKYAILATIFFVIEPNIVENSIFAITEPFFIFLGLISLYFIIQKEEKFIFLSFLFAGLAFDTRLNGIVLFFLAILVCGMKIRPKQKLVFYLSTGIIIFLITSIPHIMLPLEEGDLPFITNIENVVNVVSEGKQFRWNESISNPTPINIIKNALTNEFLHVFRISVPYLAIFVPFGIIMALRNFDLQKKVLFAAIIISLIIAIPQYTMSTEYRNLFFITALFSILAAIGVQSITNNIKLKNIFLILLVAGLLLVSYNFLRERYEIDYELVSEKEIFGKYVVNNYQGVMMGDMKLDTMLQMKKVKLDLRPDGGGGVYNDKINFFSPALKFDTHEKLMNYANQKKISYLIMDNISDRHFPAFQEIFYNENDFPYLEKVFDSQQEGYKKLRVKIFEIDYNKLE